MSPETGPKDSTAIEVDTNGCTPIPDTWKDPDTFAEELGYIAELLYEVGNRCLTKQGLRRADVDEWGIYIALGFFPPGVKTPEGFQDLINDEMQEGQKRKRKRKKQS